MKYPLDSQALADIAQDIIQHDKYQKVLIDDFVRLTQEAMELVDEDDGEDWLKDANTLLGIVSRRKIEFENHRFNQKNGYNVGQRSPFPDTSEEVLNTDSVPGIPIDHKMEANLNAIEAKEFGEEMTESELPAMFREATPQIAKKRLLTDKKLKKMSLEEIEEWERSQDNSNDIYKVSARVKNLARGAVKGNLTAQGDMVVNMFTHVIKSLYDFADTVPDKHTRIRLVELIRKQEEMPANLIAALFAGVKAPK